VVGVRDVHIDQVDDLDRDVVAISTRYPAGTLLPSHRHRRAQLLYGATGTMRVQTGHGSWTVPPHRAVLIPPDTSHTVLMTGTDAGAPVVTRSLYLEAGSVPWFPDRCRVVEVSPLLRELLAAAIDIEPRYARRGRDGTLLALVLHELRRAAPLPFDLPLPAEPELRALCQRFLSRPRLDTPPGQWARELNLSLRTLQRRFTAETGISPATWRRRACALHALPRLAAGHPVAEIAADLGYGTPSAFTGMFHQLLGAPPSAYRTGEPSTDS
jgi:AraC-like DNA-binding protein/quercetin dioxygenase-like cupin family protein